MKQYKFLDFNLDTQKHALFKSGKKLEIGTTALNILLVFLQKPGQVIKRDELFAEVWPDKIVSDATVYKQVQRLRKVLGDIAEDKTIITTVHGIGFEFLPEVTLAHITDEETNNQITKIKSRRPVLIISTLIVLLFFAVLQLIDKDESQNNPIISEATAQPMTVAMIPSFIVDDPKQDWMANGGVHYLAETFDKDWVMIQRISKDDLKETDPDQYALELSINKKADASVIFHVVEKDRLFISDVKIRNAEGIISEKTFTASSVTDLLDEISAWSKQVLELKSSGISPIMSDDRYAVENYIRGMSAQLSGDAKTAIKYFELATHEDDGFWLAWYELSISYQKQGNNQKALSIINSLEKITQGNEYIVMLMSAKANIFHLLGELENALAAVNSGIAVVEKEIDDEHMLSVLLVNKGVFSAALGDFDTAIESVGAAVDIFKSQSSDQNNALGISHLLLSEIYIELHQFDQATKYSQMAIENFKAVGSLRNENSARASYASNLFQTGKIKKAKKITDELLLYRQSSGDLPGQVQSILPLIRIHVLWGEFEQAEDYIQQASDLLDVTGNKFNRFSLMVEKAQLMLIKGNLPLVEDIINKLDGEHHNDAQLFVVNTLKIKYHQLRNNHETWKKLTLDLYQNADFEEEPLTYLFKAQLAIKESDYQHAEFMFEKSKEMAINQQQTMTIAEVMNAYIGFLIDNEEGKKAQKMIDELADFSPQNFPYLKNKAKLAFLNKEYFAALTMMQQLKNTANDHWSIDDSLLLEKYQEAQTITD